MQARKITFFFCTLTIMLLALVACQPLEPPATEPIAMENAAEEDPVYADPQGLFTAPIPTNWTAQQADGYGILSSPNDGIQVYVLAVAADDLEAAVQDAWQMVDPAFELEPDQILEEPAGRVERAITVTYDSEDEDRFALGGGWLHDGIAYITLVKGDLVSVQQRVSQMQIILSGYDILAIEDVNLAGVEPMPITPEVLDALEAYIEEAMAEFGIPGATVAVVQGDEIVYTGGFGARDPQSGEPVTPETRMMIGSTSKTMTTLAMAMLADQGAFDWDTPVVEILPTFAVADPTITEQLTVENLVCACTGVPRRDMELFFNYDELDAETIVESLADFEFFTDFGEAFQYSNQMVATGGYVAAAAAGGEYGDLYDAYVALVQDRVLDPINMPRTTLDFQTVLNGENYAIPHELTLEGEYRPLPIDWERFVTPVAPAGAYWSTAEDMGRYLITELNRGVTPDGERIVSAENLSHTWEPQVPIAADVFYGLGWIISDYKGQPVIAHGGNTMGFTSELAFLPEADIGISVITNAWGTNAFNEAVRTRLLELVFLQEFAADEAATFQFETLRSQMADLAAKVADAVDPDIVTPFLGDYENAALGAVTLALEEGEAALRCRRVCGRDPSGVGRCRLRGTLHALRLSAGRRYPETCRGRSRATALSSLARAWWNMSLRRLGHSLLLQADAC